MTAAPEPATTPPPTFERSRRESGKLLGGRYALGSKLGEGGMGVVYRARDTVLHRTVAVKVFRDGAAEPARTAAETHILAGLNHAALVTLFDAQVGAATPRYLVMEYIDGPTLSERLTAGPLSAKSVADMARDLGDALHAVHGAGIVHRDIKPSNVLLRSSTVPGEEFRAKLADFGIAYLVDTTRLTAPGTVLGSAAYLSPEQVRGALPAASADVYSLGLVLLEALTGERGFPQTSVHEAAVVRLTQDPVIPSTVPPAWAALISRMTSREPEQRPTPHELVTLVAGLDEPAHAPELGPTTPMAEPAAAPPGGRDQRGWAPEDAPTRATTLKSDPEDSHTLVMRSREHPGSVASSKRARLLKNGMLSGLVVALLIAAGITLASITGASSPRSPAPTLPTLEEPVNTHLRQLLDAVSP